MKIFWGIVVVVAVIVLFVVWWGSPGVRAPLPSPPATTGSPGRPPGDIGAGALGPRTDPSGAPGRPAATPGAKPSSP
jgi:hypothetical protein